MTIKYSCVARGTVIVCSAQAGQGNFADTMQSMLPNIPSRSDAKKTYTSNNYEFHCLVENGFLYICATDPGISKQQPYGFLADIKKRFTSGNLAGRAMVSHPGELDSDFSYVLNQQMTKFSKEGVHANSAVNAIQKQVDEVKGVMSQNIEKVLDRGEKLEDLVDKTEELEAASATFQKTARKIQKRYWWRNKKMTLIIVGVCLLLVLIITFIVLSQTGAFDSSDDSSTTDPPSTS